MGSWQPHLCLRLCVTPLRIVSASGMTTGLGRAPQSSAWRHTPLLRRRGGEGGSCVLPVHGRVCSVPHGWLPPAPYSSSSSAMLCGEPPQALPVATVTSNAANPQELYSPGGPLDVLQGSRLCCALSVAVASVTPNVATMDFQTTLPRLFPGEACGQGVCKTYAPRQLDVMKLSAAASCLKALRVVQCGVSAGGRPHCCPPGC